MKGFDITNYKRKFHNPNASIGGSYKLEEVEEDTRMEEFLCSGGKIEKIPMGMSGIAHRTLRQQNEHSYQQAKIKGGEKK